jgi:transposase-like protein
VRQQRWPEGVHCPACGSGTVVRDGFGEIQAHRQRYRCKACAGRFDDLTGTLLAGHHQPLRVWVLCLYFMGLNLSTRQIAQELGLDGSDVQAMTEQLRRGLVAKAPPVRLEGEVEIDEVYVVAGHKGHPPADTHDARVRESPSCSWSLHSHSSNTDTQAGRDSIAEWLVYNRHPAAILHHSEERLGRPMMLVRTE